MDVFSAALAVQNVGYSEVRRKTKMALNDLNPFRTPLPGSLPFPFFSCSHAA
jgi:hypothetical protein